MWIENYARKVEQLPTRNVDPDLLEYGKYVAQTFRAIVDEASGAARQGRRGVSSRWSPTTALATCPRPAR